MQKFLTIAVRSLLKRKLRAWLTVIGIIIGVAAIVSLLLIGEGLQNAVNEEFEKVGSNRIIIAPGGVYTGPGGSGLSSAILTQKDVDVINRVNGVQVSAPVLIENGRVKFRDKTIYTYIGGFPVTDPKVRAAIEGIGFFEIEEGRQLKPSDQNSAVIGNILAHEVFGKNISLRDRIEVEGITFTVVGIQKKAGTEIHDVMVRMPEDIARKIFDKPEEISQIFVTTYEGLNVTEIAEKIKTDLRKSRDVKEGEEDFTVQTSEQLIASFRTILGAVNAILAGIAAISLIVGGVGIMNTMFTSVLERTRDIGIMKAVGAKNSQVMIIFLIEAGLIGVVGGILGAALGLGIAKLAEFIALQYGVAALKVSISFGIIFGALLFSFISGSISGLWPARIASLMKPVDALRKR